MVENSRSDALGPGVTDQMVENAITTSGYPLQLLVSSMLRESFFLQEEWGYIDSDTRSTRTIDIVASRQLYDLKQDEPPARIRPELHFIIECKQSELPYIFFLSDGKPWVHHFPGIAGLKNNEIQITSDDDPATWSFDPLHLIGLDQSPFLTEAAPVCITFSKCVRKSPNLVLDGSNAYNSIMSPILKAIAHFEKVQHPPTTAYYFDCQLVIGLAVLDAPMVGVRITKTGQERTRLSWVRVVRRQPHEGIHKYDNSRVFGVDIVHKDYLQAYIQQHVLPFAEQFAERALRHAQVLADGKGFISGMGSNSWTELEERLQPSGVVTSAKRAKSILGRITGLLIVRRN